MFGCIAAGRPVQTNPTQITPTQFTFTLPFPPHTLNHLVVFLIPGTLLPPGTAAAVYIHFPGSSSLSSSPLSTNANINSYTSPSKQQEWKLLGAIANEKPSAIFRIRGSSGSGNDLPSNATAVVVDQDEMTDEPTPTTSMLAPQVTPTPLPTSPAVVLGISIEPIQSVEAQLSTLKDSPAIQAPLPQLNAIVPAKPPAALPLPPQVITALTKRIIKNCYNYLASFGEKGRDGQDVVPLKAFQEWWMKFEKRVEYDSSFLEREE